MLLNLCIYKRFLLSPKATPDKVFFILIMLCLLFCFLVQTAVNGELTYDYFDNLRKANSDIVYTLPIYYNYWTKDLFPEYYTLFKERYELGPQPNSGTANAQSPNSYYGSETEQNAIYKDFILYPKRILGQQRVTNSANPYSPCKDNTVKSSYLPNGKPTQSNGFCLPLDNGKGSQEDCTEDHLLKLITTDVSANKIETMNNCVQKCTNNEYCGGFTFCADYSGQLECKLFHYDATFQNTEQGGNEKACGNAQNTMKAACLSGILPLRGPPTPSPSNPPTKLPTTLSPTLPDATRQPTTKPPTPNPTVSKSLYTDAFGAFGCCNENPSALSEWREMSEADVLDAMWAECWIARDAKVTTEQCGCVPEECVFQTSLNGGSRCPKSHPWVYMVGPEENRTKSWGGVYEEYSYCCEHDSDHNGTPFSGTRPKDRVGRYCYQNSHVDCPSPPCDDYQLNSVSDSPVSTGTLNYCLECLQYYLPGVQVINEIVDFTKQLTVGQKSLLYEQCFYDPNSAGTRPRKGQRASVQGMCATTAFVNEKAPNTQSEMCDFYGRSVNFPDIVRDAEIDRWITYACSMMQTDIDGSWGEQAMSRDSICPPFTDGNSFCYETCGLTITTVIQACEEEQSMRSGHHTPYLPIYLCSFYNPNDEPGASDCEVRYTPNAIAAQNAFRGRLATLGATSGFKEYFSIWKNMTFTSPPGSISVNVTDLTPPPTTSIGCLNDPTAEGCEENSDGFSDRPDWDDQNPVGGGGGSSPTPSVSDVSSPSSSGTSTGATIGIVFFVVVVLALIYTKLVENYGLLEYLPYRLLKFLRPKIEPVQGNSYGVGVKTIELVKTVP